jgi:DNA-binding GntR family transcriptional regulator
MPTEVELANALALSLGTVQRALRMLVEDAAIVRKPGAGTRIADAAREMDSPLHCRFAEPGQVGFLPVYSKLLERHVVTAEGPWTEHLGIGSSMRIERMLDIGGRFHVLSRFYVDPASFPIFGSANTTKLEGANFKSLITESSGLAVNQVQQFVSFVKPDARMRECLNLPRNAMATRFDLYAFAGTAMPAYYQELYTPPFTQRLQLRGS